MKAPSKLVIRRERLRELNPRDLARLACGVVGGDGSAGAACTALALAATQPADVCTIVG